MPNDILFVLTVLGGLLVLGNGLIAGSIYLLKRARSPFITIYHNSVEIFSSHWKLQIFPILSLASLVVLIYGVYALGPLIVPFVGNGHADPKNRIAELMTFGLAGLASIIGTVLFVVINGPMIEYLLAYGEGKSESLVRATWRISHRLVSILGFTILWSALLAVIFLTSLKMQEWLRSWGLEWLNALVTFAEWTLEMGVTMASYFMFVVMIRENVRPWQALSITTEIVKEEFGKTFPEVMRIEAMDSGVAIISGVVFFAWIGLLVALGVYASLVHPLAILKNIDLDRYGLLLTLGIPTAAVILIHACYYVCWQTLQIILAVAVYLYLKDGILMEGFQKDDFDHVLGLRASGLREIPRLMTLLSSHG